MAEEKTIITLICERAAEVDSVMNENDTLKDQPNVKVIKFPCSGMIQPLMVETALKAGASGVVVCGCQIGDCYFREGNRMIKERLLGGRPPGLKANTDRRRVLALWLSRKQTDRFLSQTKEFVSFVSSLEDAGAKAAVPKQAPKKVEKVEESKKAEKVEDKKAEKVEKVESTEKTESSDKDKE